MSENVCSGERRDAPDRRRRPTPMLSRYVLSGRRRAFRREAEGLNAYVDRYDGRMLATMVSIVGLCLFDALFTLLYLQKGGQEMNPLMQRVIEAGVLPFLAVKVGLTLVGMLFLCLHKNFRLVKGLITFILAVYLALTGYHLYLAWLY